MSTKLEKGILRGLKQALEIAQGTADPSTYAVHDASEFMTKEAQDEETDAAASSGRDVA